MDTIFEKISVSVSQSYFRKNFKLPFVEQPIMAVFRESNIND